MDKPLWEFIDDKATFGSESACHINTLYFPLCNNYPFMSSISPDLHGDIKNGFNSFLMEPVSRPDLSNLKSSRNFWIYLHPASPCTQGLGWAWSATGVSKDPQTAKDDEFELSAGLLWHKITRQNKKIGLKCAITSFVPASNEPVEIMFVEISNISPKTIRFVPTAAIPLYARSANNLHDHRQVTSLLSRVKLHKAGVIVTPTLSFNERGHKKNETSYFVLGQDFKSGYPVYIYPSQEEFTGCGSDLEAPQAVLKDLSPEKKANYQGREPFAGLKFKEISLKAKGQCSYIIIMGITNDNKKINALLNKFNTPKKVLKALNSTKSFWQKKNEKISLHTKDLTYDNWFRWVNIQPELRKIFGCSFLPDFDYGKGGRGWRDLWQDCLSLILTTPDLVRPLLVNNFKGVRIDGSNATIIGNSPGEFIADRNNISRVWMDHGIWPLITTHLYIHQTQDLKILLERIPYFKDQQLCRGREKDWDWKPEYGKELKTKNGEIYQGSLLEHILVQNLVQFFNVGGHNHIRLEGADWNDGLDMAAEFGESVAFSCLYAQNLKSIAEILEKLPLENIIIFKELAILLDSPAKAKSDYSDIIQKQNTLNEYFRSVKFEISGETIPIPKAILVNDLKRKSLWLTSHIRETEWIGPGFFNGYYDNNGQRLEGKKGALMRMTLTGQVFPVMSSVATKEQTEILFQNCCKYLKDKNLPGFHLNTDFKQEQPAMGRAFSFVYGDKENGAFFNHMTVMFAYALYKQGFAKEGFQVLNSIYEMAKDTAKSKIYPCLPEYFNAQGRGMYSYLTGSASWYVLTMLTQVFGIKGEYGDLIIQPKLVKEQFQKSNCIGISAVFCARIIKVSFINQNKKEFGQYRIKKVSLNGKTVSSTLENSCFCLPRQDFIKLANKSLNTIEVVLD